MVPVELMHREKGIMRKDEEVELLSRVDLFDSLSKEEIRQLLDENPDVRLGEGETFYAPWEHDGELFILKKGRMRLYRTEGAREFTLEVVEAGMVFGEMAFTPYRLRASFARTMEPSVVFAMERAEIVEGEIGAALGAVKAIEVSVRLARGGW